MRKLRGLLETDPRHAAQLQEPNEFDQVRIKILLPPQEACRILTT
ncbi:unnamed protein product [Moneuplotes crassus]|uniref:Uncharacterized protein n=1 Tax=Euplotes crassus TaxID=5936 RepID=A0AAD1U7A0_EUPCR|nr:unnamed protein product [Moneuplotes crassus]